MIVSLEGFQGGESVATTARGLVLHVGDNTLSSPVDSSNNGFGVALLRVGICKVWVSLGVDGGFVEGSSVQSHHVLEFIIRQICELVGFKLEIFVLSVVLFDELQILLEVAQSVLEFLVVFIVSLELAHEA